MYLLSIQSYSIQIGNSYIEGLPYRLITVNSKHIPVWICCGSLNWTRAESRLLYRIFTRTTSPYTPANISLRISLILCQNSTRHIKCMLELPYLLFTFPFIRLVFCNLRYTRRHVTWYWCDCCACGRVIYTIELGKAWSEIDVRCSDTWEPKQCMREVVYCCPVSLYGLTNGCVVNNNLPHLTHTH